MRRMEWRWSVVLAVIAAGFCGGWIFPDSGRAQEFPTKPITCVLAFASGGGTERAARLCNQYAEKELKQPISIINKPGASGEIGWTYLSQARPDGYTIGWLNSPNVITIPIQRKAAYRPEDLAPICNIILDPGVLGVRVGSPLDTIEKVIEQAKKQPGSVSYGTTGVGSDDHIAVMAIEKDAGVKLSHVVFDGAAANTLSVIGGHTTLIAGNLGEVIPYVRGGKVKIIGVMHETRLSDLPDVPTFLEKGIKVVSSSNRGIGAPKNVPTAILNKLESAFLKVKDNPEFLKKAKEMDLPLNILGSKAYEDLLKKQAVFYRSLWEKQPWM